jgi:hypothetical protein
MFREKLKRNTTLYFKNIDIDELCDRLTEAIEREENVMFLKVPEINGPEWPK